MPKAKLLLKVNDFLETVMPERKPLFEQELFFNLPKRHNASEQARAACFVGSAKQRNGVTPGKEIGTSTLATILEAIEQARRPFLFGSEGAFLLLLHKFKT
jgi:hypothetical protein